MARTAPTIDLTDADKRDLISLIQDGKPLPEKYRFALFEDKREVELLSAPHIYAQPCSYQVAVKVIDIFGNDTMTLIPVTVD